MIRHEGSLQCQLLAEFDVIRSLGVLAGETRGPVELLLFCECFVRLSKSAC